MSRIGSTWKLAETRLLNRLRLLREFGDKQATLQHNDDSTLTLDTTSCQSTTFTKTLNKGLDQAIFMRTTHWRRQSNRRK